MLSRLSDRGRRRLRTTLTILVTALLVAPAAALATHGFNDVNDSDFYHAAVDWMKDNGVTVGCNPPDNTRYCPEDNVTRGEMAVFLERLDSKNVFVRPGDDAVDGGNADTVDGMHASDFLGANEKAADSDKLDGKDASAFFQVGDSIDADTLDGKDSTTFATAAELDSLDTFIPVATFTVINGRMENLQFRDPITDTPTISGSDGAFEIELPGFSFNIFGGLGRGPVDMAVCTAVLRNLNVHIDGQSSGNLEVELWKHDGTRASSADDEDDFSCAVYDGS